MVQPAVSQMEEEWVDEGSGEEAEGDDEARALQPRLLARVRAASGEPEGRAGVWMEHSYARAKSGAGAVRVLLARPTSPGPTELDVVTPDPEPMHIPGDEPPPDIAESDDDQPDWEARVLALAPTPVYHRLARSAIDALIELRLARLAGGPKVTASVRRDDARHAARSLRCALAPLWAASGPHGGPVSWLVSTISAHVGKAMGALWREMLCELRGAAPRLATRLVPVPPAPPPDPLDRIGPAVSGSGPGPWLVWIAVGPEEARWPRRLRALLHTHVVRADGGARGAPEAWCSAGAAAARQALVDVIAEAGSRPVIVGGAGAGAALASALLAGSAGVGAGVVRALVLLAPPLLTAEGESTHLHRSELDIPLLIVVGSAGAACSRGAALELLAGSSGSARRVVEVRGADDALRLPARLRRRLSVPQAALDAAVADECVRWAMQAAEGEPPQRKTPRKGAGEVTEERRAVHAARALLREAEPSSEQTRVISRGLGATPLALLPPRRATPATPVTPAPTPVIEEPELDIMQLPIVFADDEPTPPVATPAPVVKRPEITGSPSVTVTSGHPRGGRALNYTRVIVAKRRGGGATTRGAGGARPVLLRRTVRLVQKGRPH